MVRINDRTQRHLAPPGVERKARRTPVRACWHNFFLRSAVRQEMVVADNCDPREAWRPEMQTVSENQGEKW